MVSGRMKITVITGALLGLICIAGAGFRIGFAGNYLLIGALWYNRLLMGIVIGLARTVVIRTALLRGAFLGLLVSLAYYLSTGLSDPVSFGAGIIYGIIIEFAAARWE